MPWACCCVPTTISMSQLSQIFLMCWSVADTPYPATGMNQLASFVRIKTGEAFTTQANATSQVFYCIRYVHGIQSVVIRHWHVSPLCTCHLSVLTGDAYHATIVLWLRFQVSASTKALPTLSAAGPERTSARLPAATVQANTRPPRTKLALGCDTLSTT